MFYNNEICLQFSLFEPWKPDVDSQMKTLWWKKDGILMTTMMKEWDLLYNLEEVLTKICIWILSWCEQGPPSSYTERIGIKFCFIRDISVNYREVHDIRYRSQIYILCNVAVLWNPFMYELKKIIPWVNSFIQTMFM